MNWSRPSAQSTNGTLEFGEGCVYPILHRLEAEGHAGQQAGDGGGPKPGRLSGHGQRLEAACQHDDRLAADRPGRSTMPCTEANMASQPWLDEVRERLVKHACRRLRSAIHGRTGRSFQDITEETMSTKDELFLDWANRNKWPKRPLLPIGGGVFCGGIPRRRSWYFFSLRPCRSLAWGLSFSHSSLLRSTIASSGFAGSTPTHLGPSQRPHSNASSV